MGSTVSTAKAWLALIVRHFTIAPDGICRRHYQRQSARQDMVGFATVEFDASTGKAPLHLNVTDVSLGGLMLRAYEPFSVGSMVTLSILIGGDRIALHGIVRHCTETIGGSKVGVSFAFDEDGCDACAPPDPRAIGPAL